MQVLAGSDLLDPCDDRVWNKLQDKCTPPHDIRPPPAAPADLADDSKYGWSIGEITATASDGEECQVSALLFVSTHMHRLRCQDHAGVTCEHWGNADYEFMEQ